jgi:hypothetical protein
MENGKIICLFLLTKRFFIKKSDLNLADLKEGRLLKIIFAAKILILNWLILWSNYYVYNRAACPF